jgi:hypothetical protein
MQHDYSVQPLGCPHFLDSSYKRGTWCAISCNKNDGTISVGGEMPRVLKFSPILFCSRYRFFFSQTEVSARVVDAELGPAFAEFHKPGAPPVSPRTKRALGALALYNEKKQGPAARVFKGGA